jgi:hypothetical protein
MDGQRLRKEVNGSWIRKRAPSSARLSTWIVPCYSLIMSIAPKKSPKVVPATWHIHSEKAAVRRIECCAGYLAHPFWKKQLESDLLVPICLRERSGTGRIRESACISYVDTILFAKEKPVFPVLIPLRHRITLCFHALSDGIIRWMKPRSTSFLLGTITDLAKGKSELLVENALLRQQLIILHRQVKRPACKKTDRFLLVRAARG